MGRAIPKGAQLSHVQAKISRKLNQLSRSKLSFARRVLIANQVMFILMLDYEACRSARD